MKKMFSFVASTALLTIITIVFTIVLVNTSHAQDFGQIDKLIAKYRPSTTERPKSCPLESKKFADLLAKTETIKSIFKSNCLQQDQNKMNEVLNSVQDIQDELKKRSIIDKTIDGQTIVNAVTGNSSSNSSTNALSGIKFSTLFSNITNMIKKNQCNLDDGRVLEMTADLIYDSTQLGLLSGNNLGIIVAGGGFIISSALRLIDMIFKQRFDFEKNQDRQTFIKLNCSFYDIRKDFEAQGVLDIENNSNREDLRDVNDFIEKLNISLKTIDQEKSDQKKIFELADQQNVTSQVGDISVFKKSLLKIKGYLISGIVDSGELPSETQKLLLISKLAQDYDLLFIQLNDYRSLNVSSMPMLDNLLLLELKKFDQIDPLFVSQTMNMSPKDFNDNLRPKILFHVTRILGDIAAKEELALSQNQEIKKVSAFEVQKKQDLYNGKLTELKKLEERLNKTVASKDYSASDDGSENMISLLDNYKNISKQIYGEWGEKFLRFTTMKSYVEVKNFKEKMDRFNTKYGERLKKFSIDKALAPYICQDIQRIRVSFKFADGVVQEGYDFVVTNKELFHTDDRNYYNSSLDEESSFSASSSVEKIQRHYRSTILALRKLKKEEVDPSDEEKYLTRSFTGISYLGRSMIDVSEAKIHARGIQERYEQLNCNKTLADDLN